MSGVKEYVVHFAAGMFASQTPERSTVGVAERVAVASGGPEVCARKAEQQASIAVCARIALIKKFRKLCLRGSRFGLLIWPNLALYIRHQAFRALQLQYARAVSGAMAGEGDRISRLQGILLPAEPAQMVVAALLSQPMLDFALVADHVDVDQRVGIHELELRHRSLQRGQLVHLKRGCPVVRGRRVRERQNPNKHADERKDFVLQETPLDLSRIIPPSSVDCQLFSELE